MTKQSAILAGKDGIELLHRLSTIDVLGLKCGVDQDGLILNSFGKIRTIFTIHKISTDKAKLYFESNFISILEQMTFSEDYSLSNLQDTEDSPSQIDEEHRILKCIPKLGFEFELDEKTNPLEINLRHLIHDQKGCYPGQEVIEKIISLGSPAKKLISLQSSKLVETPLKTILFDQNEKELGIITSKSNQNYLAIVKKTFNNETLYYNFENSKFELNPIK